MLYGLPVSLLSRLQLLQNSAARLVTRTRKYEHITSVLYRLHWLPVSHRCQFKILLFTFTILEGPAPGYLCDLVTRVESRRVTRSAAASRLQVPRYSQEFYGARAFAVVAPRLWNVLPNDIPTITNLSSFKSALKTHVFRSYFNG